MLTRLLTIWESVRSSLWALPLLIVVGACGLAYVALSASTKGAPPIWVLFGGSGEQAPDFLSSLMTAMINMSTLAISITMVVLALAAQQLGPRLIRSFMNDRRTQLSLGLFVGTVVYLVIVLRSAYGDGKSVPNIAVTGGTLLVLICLFALLLFVHNLARSIVADSVIERVGAQFDHDIRRLCPEHSEGADERPKLAAERAQVPVREGGYVQAIDYGAIARAAAKADAIVSMEVRAGHHTVAGVVAATITPEDACNDELEQAIQSAVIVGSERTTVQDLEYSARHLVEIALRALSPGINDVYTALAVINRLTLSLRGMMLRAAPQSMWKDGKGKVRVVAPVSTFAGVVDAAFNQIRQNAGGKPAVLIRVAESLGQLLQQANDEQRLPLERHLRLLLAEGKRSIAEHDDLHDLEARVRDADAGSGRASVRRRKRA